MNVPARDKNPLRPRQSLGQNFLRDENIARKIVATLDVQRSDVVLEIGPGEAALTKYLVSATPHVIAVDIDKRVIDKLALRYPANEVELLQRDFLETDFADIARRKNVDTLRIVGNIPYNITTPILFHILDHRTHVRDATLMMQKEVARRLIAKPNTKEYGILSVSFQLFTRIELLFDVSPRCFFPAPKVTSSVVRFTTLPSPRYEIRSEEFFRAFVRAVFGKRRKTLRNSLGHFLGSVPPVSFDLQKRPEQLSLEELVALGNQLFRNSPFNTPK